MGKNAGEPQNVISAKRPCASSALDFDQLPFVQSAVADSQANEYSCFTPLPTDEETSLEFRIDKTDQYTDISRAMLYIKVQILYKDGTKLGPDDLCAFVNNIGYALFDSVDLYISDQKVTKTESFYAWWTYVYNLIYYSDQATKTFLEAANCWNLDRAGFMEDFDFATPPSNTGLLARHSKCGESKALWLATRVMLNMPVARLLPSQTEIMLRFHRAPTNSCLLAESDKAYKIRILEAKLQATKVRLFDDAQREYEKKLSTVGFLYPMTSPVIRTKTISVGDQNVDWTPFNGRLPQRLIFWQISQTAYNGQLNKNQYCFLPYNINKMQIFKNGKSVPSGQGLVNMQQGRYLSSFLNTAEAINSPDTFKIPFDYYKNGYFLVAVDISSDFSAGCDYDNIDEYGSLRIVVDYSEPVKEALTIFCLGETQEIMRIDSDRNPSVL